MKKVKSAVARDAAQLVAVFGIELFHRDKAIQRD